MRRWLIRSNSNKILGPVSKALIIDLMKKGALKEEDEVTSGNGHWFYLWEKALVDSYVFGDKEQDFNPVSVVKSVIIQRDVDPETVGKTMVLNIKNLENQQKSIDNDVARFTSLELEEQGQDDSDDIKYPDSDDLTFPDIEIADSANAATPTESPLKLDIEDGSASKDSLEIEADVGVSTENSSLILDVKTRQDFTGTGYSASRPSRATSSRPVENKKKSGDDRFLFAILYGVAFILLVILIKFVRIILR